MVNFIRRRIVMAGALSPLAPHVFGAPNTIPAENSLVGDATWRVSRYPTYFDWSSQTYSPGVPYDEIEGYASASSVNIGETIGFHVSCVEASYTLKVFRLGWYNGRGARLMTQVQLPGIKQQIPIANLLGTIDCNWAQTYSLNIPTSWVSGIYYVKLVAASGVESAITFVVRDDARDAGFIFQCASNTYQAYNNWGGKSLYEFNSKGGQKATVVSFNRPDNDEGGASKVPKWELPMVRFLEREGYDVKYICNMDIHVNPSILLRGKALLTVGHDEYWTYEMKSAVQSALGAGVHMAFLTSNACYWQVRLSGRTMVGYKENYAADPFMSTDRKRVTAKWRDLPRIGVSDPICRPENNFIGVQYHGDPVNGDLVVFDPNHWIFAGTGVVKGTRFPGLLGHETDAIFANGYSPANLEKVFESPDPYGFAHATCYTHPSGAIVFAAGTMTWSWGVDYVPSWAPNNGNRTNAVFQQINRNLLNRMAGSVLLKAPTNVRVTDKVIQWDAVTGAATYDLHRSGTPNAPIGTPYKSGLTTPSFVENAPLSTTGYYKVVARNGAASSSPSAEVSIAGGSTGGSTPSTVAPPTGLTGYSCNTRCWAYSSQGGAAVRINWTQSSSPGIVSNDIYRSIGATGTPVLIATIPANVMYVDKNVVLDTTYRYRVTATDNKGTTSALSNGATIPFTA